MTILPVKTVIFIRKYSKINSSIKGYPNEKKI